MKMNKQNFLEYFFLFFSASLAAMYKYFTAKKRTMNLLITQMLFGAFIAFIGVPYLAEKLELTYKASLFFTWVLTFFSNATLDMFFRGTYGAKAETQTTTEKTENND